MKKKKIICNLLLATILSSTVLPANVVNASTVNSEGAHNIVEQKLAHSNGLIQYSYSDNNYENLQYIDLVESTDLEVDNDSTKSVKWVGYITPDETGEYSFDATNADIFINGMPVLVNGNPHSINMKEGTYYKIEIKSVLDPEILDQEKVDIDDHSSTSPQAVTATLDINKNDDNSQTIYWANNGSEKSQIPLENIYSTVDKEYLPHLSRLRSTTSSDDATDNDKDGIPDELEMNGVAYFRGRLYSADAAEIKQYVDNGQIKTYKTSPNAMSTDGDPFTDLDEIKKTTIVKSETSDLGSNPLIAAAPVIRLNVKNISVTPNQQISFTNGQTFGSSITNSVTTTEAKETTDSVDTGFSLADLFTFRLGFKRDTKSGASVATAQINGVNLGLDFRTAVNVNTSEAAYLNLEMEYQNIGTAAAHNVNPNFSIKLGNDTIFTVQPSDNTKEEILRPNETSISKNIGYFGSKDQKIPVSIAQLQRIQNGEKLTIVYDQNEIAGQALMSLNPSTLDSWSNYFSGMDQFAKIDLSVGNKQVKKLKIYAAGEDAFINGDPEITLKEALQSLYNLRKDGENTLISYINENGVTTDLKVNDNMIIAFDDSTTQSLKVQLSNNNNNVDALKLRPGMNVLLSTNDPEDVQTQQATDLTKELTQADLATRESRERIITEIESQINHPIQKLKVQVGIPGLYNNVPFTWGSTTTTFVGHPASYEAFRHLSSFNPPTETVEISRDDFLGGTGTLGGNNWNESDFPFTNVPNNYKGGFMRSDATNGKRLASDLIYKVTGVVADISTTIH